MDTPRQPRPDPTPSHPCAALATHGLTLFQQGKQAEAMAPLLEAARELEPRACYIVGIALFNGDLLRRDLALAERLMTIATDAGIPQAAAALAQISAAAGIARHDDAASLISDHCLLASRLELAMLAAPSRPAAATLADLLEELVRPLLGERLEMLLPAAFARAAQAAAPLR